MTVKLERAVLTHDCGVGCPGSGVHAASTGAQRGYSLKTASLTCADGSFHSGVRSWPSTSGGGGRPASAASVGSGPSTTKSELRLRWPRENVVVAGLTDVEALDKRVGLEAGGLPGRVENQRDARAELKVRVLAPLPARHITPCQTPQLARSKRDFERTMLCSPSCHPYTQQTRPL